MTSRKHCRATASGKKIIRNFPEVTRLVFEMAFTEKRDSRGNRDIDLEKF
jgi:hypothetical protein